MCFDLICTASVGLSQAFLLCEMTTKQHAIYDAVLTLSNLRTNGTKISKIQLCFCRTISPKTNKTDKNVDWCFMEKRLNMTLSTVNCNYFSRHKPSFRFVVYK